MDHAHRQADLPVVRHHPAETPACRRVEMDRPLYNACATGNLEQLQVLAGGDLARLGILAHLRALVDAELAQLRALADDGRVILIQVQLRALVDGIMASLTQGQFQALVGEPDILTQEQLRALDLAQGQPLGDTPLHVAVQNGHLEIVVYLLDHIPELADTYGEQELTPLHLAAMVGNTDIIRAILDRKSNCIEQMTRAGENILHLMAKHGQHRAFACTFLAYDLHNLAAETDRDGNTVLHLSVRGRSIGLVEFIIQERLVHKNICNKEGNRVGGKTALDVAIEELGHHEWEQMLACLRKAECITGRELMMRGGPGFLKEQFDFATKTMVAAAVLIATLAFTTMIDPPGGVYHDGPLAGKAILSTHPLFHIFFFFNVAALLASLSMVVICSTFVFWTRIAVSHTRRLLTALMVASTLFICMDYATSAWMIYLPGKLKTPSIILLYAGVGVTTVAIISFHLAHQTN